MLKVRKMNRTFRVFFFLVFVVHTIFKSGFKTPTFPEKNTLNLYIETVLSTEQIESMLTIVYINFNTSLLHSCFLSSVL